MREFTDIARNEHLKKLGANVRCFIRWKRSLPSRHSEYCTYYSTVYLRLYFLNFTFPLKFIEPLSTSRGVGERSSISNKFTATSIKWLSLRYANVSLKLVVYRCFSPLRRKIHAVRDVGALDSRRKETAISRDSRDLFHIFVFAGYIYIYIYPPRASRSAETQTENV